MPDEPTDTVARQRRIEELRRFGPEHTEMKRQQLRRLVSCKKCGRLDPAMYHGWCPMCLQSVGGDSSAKVWAE